ncbi:MAG: serine hydrolase domain-containing protein, partial [Terriglobales bacterium]
MKSALLLCVTLLPWAVGAQQAVPSIGTRKSLDSVVLDSIVLDAIHDKQIPGAVILVGHNGQVVYRKALGERSLEPHREPMTLDTIFDIASLTK